VTFGEALLKARGKMGQAKLARAVGVDPSAISQVERGKRNTLSADVVAKIESVLGVPDGSLVKHLPKKHPAHLAAGSAIPDMGLVWGSPPRDVPEPMPGKVYYLTGRFPPGTFALKVSGHSVERYGVHDGDIIAIQPSGEPQDGMLVVARQGNAYTLKGYHGDKLYSFGRNDEMPKELDVGEPLQVVGVMIGVIEGERRFTPRVKAKSKPIR
jgi:SOS-response transcriptional repressor LexA